MTSGNVAAILFIGIFLSSCTFIPDGDPITNVDPSQPTATEVDLFASQDTLLLRGFVYFQLSIATTDKIKDYAFLIDDSLVVQNDGSPQAFYFHSEKYPDGLHKVTLKLTKYYSGTSLASKLNLELYEQEFTRTIRTYNAPIVAPVLTTSIDNGTLVLHWQPYSGYQFVDYNVFANLAAYANETITEQQADSISIPDYFAGKVQVTFTLDAFGEKKTSTLIYEDSLDASIKKNNEGVAYTWTASPFSSCAGFVISQEANGTQQEFDFDNESTQYEADCSYLFPYDVTGSIYAVNAEGRKVMLSTENFSTVQRIGGTNPQYYDYAQFIKPPGNDSLLLVYYLFSTTPSYDNARVGLYNRKTGDEISTLVGRFAISPNGERIYYFDASGNIAELDQTDLSETSNSLSLASITDMRYIWTYRVSDDNIFLFHVFTVAPGVGEYVLYDGNGNSVLSTDDVSANPSISNYGILGNGGNLVYNSSGGQVIELGTTPYSTFYLWNHELPLTDRDESIHSNSSNLTLYKLPERTILKQVPYLNDYVKAMFANQEDQFGIAYLASDGTVKIDFFDQHDLHLISTLPTQLIPSKVSNYGFDLVGNELFVYLQSGPVHHISIDF